MNSTTADQEQAKPKYEFPLPLVLSILGTVSILYLCVLFYNKYGKKYVQNMIA